MTFRPALALLLPAALALAPSAGADRVGTPNTIDLPPYASPCDEELSGPAIGAVSAISGAATHAIPGCAPGPLACDAGLRAGERLATAAGSQLAVQVGDAWVQLSGDSEATLRRDAGGGTVLVLERGHARVMRTGDGAVPRIETPDLVALAPGDDVAASVVDGASSLCSWSDPIDVRSKATGRVSQAATGNCVAPAASVAATLDVSIADVARCAVAVGDLTPFDVAAGPMPGLPPVLPPPVLPPPVCTSGSCIGTPRPPAPPRVPIVEQPGGFEPPP